jgi:hypothetical protein
VSGSLPKLHPAIGIKSVTSATAGVFGIQRILNLGSHAEAGAFIAELKAHLPGRDISQRLRQAGEQRKRNHAAGSGAATGCC